MSSTKNDNSGCLFKIYLGFVFFIAGLLQFIFIGELITKGTTTASGEQIFLTVIATIWFWWAVNELINRNKSDKSEKRVRRKTRERSTERESANVGRSISPFIRYVIFPLIVYVGKAGIDNMLGRTSDPKEGITIALFSTLVLNVYLGVSD